MHLYTKGRLWSLSSASRQVFAFTVAPQRPYHLHASTLVSLLLPRDLFSSHYLASASSLIVYLDRTTTYEEHSVPLSFVCCPLSTVCRYQVGHLDVEEAVGVLMLVDVGQSSGV